MAARPLIAVGLFVAASCRGASPSGPVPAAPTGAVAPAPRTSVGHAVLTPADIAAKAVPAVVTVHSGPGLGTGFVVRSDGWIATNLHVIASAPRVSVTMRDAREFEVVEVLATSFEHDLALVRIEAKGLVALSLGDSETMRPGDPVVAIGNPLGFEDTVSNGLVSGRRTLHPGIEVLQISAPIAPGSSGGPIFNDRGDVIGVATAIVRGGQNLNFGVPTLYLLPMMVRPLPVPFAEFARQLAKLQAAAAPKPDASFAPLAPAVLDGCSLDARRLIARMLAEAIDVGAPLYNQGRADACYHVYDGTASDLERKLPPTCRGPVRALADAQAHAASSAGVSAQAWVMRHEFDALLDVVARGAHGGP